MKDYPATPDGLRADRDVEAGVLRLAFDRVDRRNALTDDIVLGLIELIEAAGSDEAVRVIHLAGEGDHFCSGFDLSLRGKPDTPPRTGATQRQMRWHVNRLIPTMLETQTPIVVAARGWIIGLGLNIVLAADFAVVDDDARLWAPFVGAGFTPDSGSSWLLPASPAWRGPRTCCCSVARCRVWRRPNGVWSTRPSKVGRWIRLPATWWRSWRRRRPWRWG